MLIDARHSEGPARADQMKCRLVAFNIACRDYLCTLHESRKVSPHFLQHQAFFLQHIRTIHTIRVCPVPSTASEFTCAPASLRTDDMKRLTASSVVQVAVGDLEWSLMSIYSTHQQLQAARAKQQRLLKTLNEVSSLTEFMAPTSRYRNLCRGIVLYIVSAI